MTKALSERLETARAKKQKADARLKALEAKASTVERKKETRRKIVIGGAVLAYMRDQPEFSQWVGLLLDRTVSRELDRQAVADLLPPVSASPAPMQTKA